MVVRVKAKSLTSLIVLSCAYIFYAYLHAEMYPQWSAVVGTDHHSDKIVPSSVYKESPRHYLSIEVKDHKFWNF